MELLHTGESLEERPSGLGGSSNVQQVRQRKLSVKCGKERRGGGEYSADKATISRRDCFAHPSKVVTLLVCVVFYEVVACRI